MSFTCPKCRRTSYHPEDERWGYCGNCHDYTEGNGYMPRERMEPQDESLMQRLQREQPTPASDPKPMEPELEPEPEPEYPSRYRFYSGALGLGFAMGISWTVFALSPPILRYITRGRAVMILYGMVAVFFGAQSWMLYKWNKELKKRREKLVEFWDQYFEPGKNPFKG